MNQKDTIHLAQEFLGRMGSFFFVSMSHSRPSRLVRLISRGAKKCYSRFDLVSPISHKRLVYGQFVMVRGRGFEPLTPTVSR
jgi:hypothetical protein